MQTAVTATAQPSAADVYALGRDPGETDPHTLVMPHLSFLAWGRKPEAQQLPIGHPGTPDQTHLFG
jgi:hypothetical protein